MDPEQRDKMSTKVILHNSVSVDGSISNFPMNMALHYQVAGSFNAQAHLIGSQTALKGLDMFLKDLPQEHEDDWKRPEGKDHLPYWIVVDSQGQLENKMHVYRRFEFCRDVIVLVSAFTPRTYIEYLNERNYLVIFSGHKKVDFGHALEVLRDDFQAETIVTDTGPTLNTHLLRQGLIHEISLIMSPTIIGDNGSKVIKSMLAPKEKLTLELIEHDVLTAHHMWLHYRVIRE